MSDPKGIQFTPEELASLVGVVGSAERLIEVYKALNQQINPDAQLSFFQIKKRVFEENDKAAKAKQRETRKKKTDAPAPPEK